MRLWRTTVGHWSMPLSTCARTGRWSSPLRRGTHSGHSRGSGGSARRGGAVARQYKPVGPLLKPKRTRTGARRHAQARAQTRTGARRHAQARADTHRCGWVKHVHILAERREIHHELGHFLDNGADRGALPFFRRRQARRLECLNCALHHAAQVRRFSASCLERAAATMMKRGWSGWVSGWSGRRSV